MRVRAMTCPAANNPPDATAFDLRSGRRLANTVRESRGCTATAAACRLLTNRSSLRPASSADRGEAATLSWPRTRLLLCRPRLRRCAEMKWPKRRLLFSNDAAGIGFDCTLLMCTAQSHPALLQMPKIVEHFERDRERAQRAFAPEGLPLLN